MAYLIKVTIVWAVLLLVFELTYKNSRNFTINRIYLVLSIAIGLLPFVPVPSIVSFPASAASDLYHAAQNVSAPPGIVPPQQAGPAALPATTDSTGWNIMPLIGVLYGAGASLFLFKRLLELFRIWVLLRRSPVRVLYGHKIVLTAKRHSPYSFLGYIFLTDIASVDPRELEYIIRHEAAHHARKHWLDLWAMQLVTIIFWFHPLVWRYRYLLQLQQEYEADAIAAGDDPYTYGRFILQQTMLRGVPSITHSFHTSPIKNRIKMLTKIQSLGYNNRRYLLLIPVLLCCTFLSAKPADKGDGEIQGNKMSFNGKILTWRASDTLFYDREKGQAELVPAHAKVKPQVIVGIDKERVYRNDDVQAQATYGNSATAFADYVREEFNKLRANTMDSLTYLVDLSVVVDKGGRVVYFDAHYARPQAMSGQQAMWNTLYAGDAHADILVDKIIAGSPLWKPATNDGKAVNSYISIRFPGC